jgi:tRNA (cytidine/uridine-2'-O-)-methyltransferase
MRLALYQPDIPQNAGTLMRLGACLGVGIEIIEPAGFQMSDRALKRAGMDYLDFAELTRHASWDAFLRAQRARGGRLLVLTAKGTPAYTEYEFAAADTLLLGRESAGAPKEVHDAADARLTIPMRPGLRSLNVALAGAMVLGEALRQTRGFPD